MFKIGAGCYVNSAVGGAAATGDGDIMLRFLPSFYAVMLMEQGHTPADACRLSIDRIAHSGSLFSGGIVCVNKEGMHSGAANNMSFTYSYMCDGDSVVQVVKVA
jgi:isoaspartyl peptidase/L-asparaginase-like protein (Ntn-hydrolase superfamily)